MQRADAATGIERRRSRPMRYFRSLLRSLSDQARLSFTAGDRWPLHFRRPQDKYQRHAADYFYDAIHATPKRMDMYDEHARQELTRR